MHSERGPQIADVGMYSDGNVQVVVEASELPTQTCVPTSRVTLGHRAPMADVFISYATPDRPLALKLAAMLETNGGVQKW